LESRYGYSRVRFTASVIFPLMLELYPTLNKELDSTKEEVIAVATDLADALMAEEVVIVAVVKGAAEKTVDREDNFRVKKNRKRCYSLNVRNSGKCKRAVSKAWRPVVIPLHLVPLD
jgi:hypothetical protein